MVYGYGRVSTKWQAKDGNSLEAQERLLKEHGAEVIYMDSFTGTKKTRPEFCIFRLVSACCMVIECMLSSVSVHVFRCIVH